MDKEMLTALEETAALARIDLSGDEEVQEALDSFSKMIDFFQEMQAAYTDSASFSEPIANLSRGAEEKLCAGLRGDAETGIYNPKNSLNEKFLENSGGRDGAFMVVPNVL